MLCLTKRPSAIVLGVFCSYPKLSSFFDGLARVKACTPWIRLSLILGFRWKAPEVSPTEEAPPLSVPGAFLFNLVVGNVSIETFDVLMDKATDWD